MLKFESLPFEGNQKIFELLAEYTNTIIAAICEDGNQKIIVSKMIDDALDGENYVALFWENGTLEVNCVCFKDGSIVSFLTPENEYSINLNYIYPTVSIIDNKTNDVRQLYSMENPYGDELNYFCYYHGLSSGRELEKPIISLSSYYQIPSRYGDIKIFTNYLNNRNPYEMVVTRYIYPLGHSKEVSTNYICVDNSYDLYGYGFYETNNDTKVIVPQRRPLTRDIIFEKVQSKGLDPVISNELASLYLNNHPIAKKLELVTSEYQKQIFR